MFQFFDIIIPFLPEKHFIIYGTVCKEWYKTLKRMRYESVTDISCFLESLSLFDWSVEVSGGYTTIEKLLPKVSRIDILEKHAPNWWWMLWLTARNALRYGHIPVLDYIQNHMDHPYNRPFRSIVDWITFSEDIPDESIDWLLENNHLSNQQDLTYIGLRLLYDGKETLTNHLLSKGIPIHANIERLVEQQRAYRASIALDAK